MKGIRGQACSPATSIPGRRVPAGIFKAADPAALISSMSHWSTPAGGGGGEEDMTNDFRNAAVVPLFNHEGSKVFCRSYCTLICLKDFGSGYPQPSDHQFCRKSLPAIQCGIRLGQSTIEIIFAVRKVQEKFIEQIIFSKVFDTVNREAPRLSF
ncbi:hypothetical protein ElyMa_000895800 [Elysia marginata]|uniref:Uncharacterized protein n=1 Tax=Elysia marginata TaxID=1093978 RepID=A0AAV4H8Z1_9GAST|nr:hypothetical protein ElyMa_000895800 [Elysia marginata]